MGAKIDAAIPSKPVAATGKLASDVLVKDPSENVAKEILKPEEKKDSGNSPKVNTQQSNAQQSSAQTSVPDFLQPKSAAVDATSVAQPH